MHTTAFFFVFVLLSILAFFPGLLACLCFFLLIFFLAFYSFAFLLSFFLTLYMYVHPFIPHKKYFHWMFKKLKCFYVKYYDQYFANEKMWAEAYQQMRFHMYVCVCVCACVFVRVCVCVCGVCVCVYVMLLAVCTEPWKLIRLSFLAKKRKTFPMMGRELSGLKKGFPEGTACWGGVKTSSCASGSSGISSRGQAVKDDLNKKKECGRKRLWCTPL